ncbi:MAG: hypothetical protein JSU96_03080 [Acidobacteriota bacterium]|nr:MAG: hypothetical protein JSU96_03080 [Acidobacteriota bacterium]
MNPEVLKILDRALEYSLWVFLVSFVLILTYGSIRLRTRKRRIGDLYEESIPDERSGSLTAGKVKINQWPVVFKSLLLSLTCSLAFFLIFIFTPLPIFQNFAASDAWQVTPLRVSSVDFERFFEGFSLNAEVWNQTTVPQQVRVRVTVIGADDKPLDDLDVEPSPNPIEPGTSSTFEVRYTENSPFIKGYKLTFFGPDDQRIPHVVGFDAR